MSSRVPDQDLARRWLALAAPLALGVAGCVPPDEPDAAPPRSDGGNAAEHCGQLTVATAGSMSGYSREHFPHWRNAGKNCDVRDSVLQRDGTDMKLSGCNVVGGRWYSVYDGRTLHRPVRRGHRPHGAAGQRLALRRRRVGRREARRLRQRPDPAAALRGFRLVSNRAKGDQDPSQWKPTEPRRTGASTRKTGSPSSTTGSSSVTSAEKAALTDMLETC